MSGAALGGIVTAMIVVYLAVVAFAVWRSGPSVQRGIDAPPMPDPVARGMELARQTLAQAEELGADQ